MLKKIFSRTVLTALLIAVQVAWLVFLFLRISDALPQVNWGLRIISLIAVFFIIKDDTDPSYKIGWVLCIAFFPLFGGLMYLLFGNMRPARRIRNRLNVELENTKKYYSGRKSITDEIADPVARGMFRYAEDVGGYAAAKNTTSEYFPVGEDMYAKMLPELEKAKDFIFFEYFIINGGKMWDSILEILRRKVAEGVDVRVIYDDVGCADYLPPKYYQTLRSYGIKAMTFNKFVPLVRTVMNNRDHRKICVIDGKVGFTGGINISDEYINQKVRFGHWKDTGVMLKGPGVENLTIMFLEMWNAFAERDGEYKDFVPAEYTEHGGESDGYVLTFSDSPLDHEAVSESIYTDILYQATDYVYITTPYLAIDRSMENALCLAAKRGVDVRMVTPGIPDKKLVFHLTRSYYAKLIKAGVKIYEYEPGFIHAKSFVSDDKFAVVGTINLDYRSLNLQFEDGALMFDTPAVKQLRDDDIETIKKSQRVELMDCRTSFFGLLLDAILRMFAPTI